MRGFKLVVDKWSPTCNNEVYYVWQLCIDVEHSQSVCNYILHVRFKFKNLPFWKNILFGPVLNCDIKYSFDFPSVIFQFVDLSFVLFIVQLPFVFFLSLWQLFNCLCKFQQKSIL